MNPLHRPHETSNQEMSGSCHCGRLSYTVVLPFEGYSIPVRRCSCSFCNKHGAVYTSHPEGSLRAVIRGPATTYCFATGTALFYVCSSCGVVPRSAEPQLQRITTELRTWHPWHGTHVDKRHTLCDISTVKYFSWNVEKNRKLQENRGISFEEIVFHIERGDVLDILEHPNQERYSGQRILIVDVDGYAYIVPFIEDDREVFLKTIIPSRKATRDYLGGS